mgnify:CR=1 FL=1
MGQRILKQIIEKDGKIRQVEEIDVAGLSLQADERLNAIIAVGSQTRLETVEELIALIDAPEGGLEGVMLALLAESDSALVAFGCRGLALIIIAPFRACCPKKNGSKKNPKRGAMIPKSERDLFIKPLRPVSAAHTGALIALQKKEAAAARPRTAASAMTVHERTKKRLRLKALRSRLGA